MYSKMCFNESPLYTYPMATGNGYITQVNQQSCRYIRSTYRITVSVSGGQSLAFHSCYRLSGDRLLRYTKLCGRIYTTDSDEPVNCPIRATRRGHMFLFGRPI